MFPQCFTCFSVSVPGRHLTKCSLATIAGSDGSGGRKGKGEGEGGEERGKGREERKRKGREERKGEEEGSRMAEYREK